MTPRLLRVVTAKDHSHLLQLNQVIFGTDQKDWPIGTRSASVWPRRGPINSPDWGCHMKSPSILLVEDSALFRMALANTLFKQLGIKVVVCSSSSLATPKRIREDVVVIDAVTWSVGQRALVKAVENLSPASPVVLLGRKDLLVNHLEALQAGAVGFVKQTASTRVLVEAVRTVIKGKVWFERELFEEIYVQHRPTGKWHQGIRLNPREKQVLALVAVGMTNKEIGQRLALGERTIKAYISNLFRETGVANRSGLTSFAITHGLAQFAPHPAA